MSLDWSTFVAHAPVRAGSFFVLTVAVAVVVGVLLGDIRLGLRIGVVLGLVFAAFAYGFIAPTDPSE